MPSEDAQDLPVALGQARADFKERVAVAFLGPRRAGKTVHCALLKDAATKRLMRHTNKRYIGIATEGSERINRITDALYDGRFPAKTTQGEAVPLTVEITSRRNRGRLSLIFHDMAGEEYDELLVKEMPTKERIRRIVSTSKIEGKPYGIMTHLLFAKIYVVAIDCSIEGTWGSSESYVKEAIRNIYDIKKRIDNLYRDKIPADMAIVFTKHDELPEDESADKLAEKLPEVRAAVERYIGGDVSWFKSRIACAKIDNGEIAKMHATRHMKELESADNAVQEIQSALEKATLGLEESKRLLDAETASLDEVKESGDAALKASRQSAHDEALRGHEAAEMRCSELTDKMDRAQSEAARIRAADPSAYGDGEGPDNRPSKPLSYNTDEYLDMIAWLIKMGNRSMGR